MLKRQLCFYLLIMKIPIEVGKDVRFCRSCSYKWLQVVHCGSSELSQHILEVWRGLRITEPTQRPWIKTSESQNTETGKKPLKNNQPLVSDHEEGLSVASPLFSPQVYVPAMDGRQQLFSPHYIDFLVQSSLRGPLDFLEATSSSPFLFMVSLLDLSMAVPLSVQRGTFCPLFPTSTSQLLSHMSPVSFRGHLAANNYVAYLVACFFLWHPIY